MKSIKYEIPGSLIGIILGDGCLSKPLTKNCRSRLSIGHSYKQKNYCFHKLQKVSELLNIRFNYREVKVYNKKLNKYYNTVQGSTLVDEYFTDLRDVFYINNKKVLTNTILESLNLEGLAYWYMDDGGICVYHKKKQISGSFLSTQSFTKEEQQLFCDWLKKEHNIETKLHKHGKGKYRVFMNKTNSKIFLDLIKPYILSEFEYKLQLDYQSYLELKPE